MNSSDFSSLPLLTARAESRDAWGSERLAAPRCAGPGCRAAHRAALRLDPSGFHPLRNTARPAAPAVTTKAALPVAGDRGLAVAVTQYVTAICFARPLDELARCSRTALRFTALRFASFAARTPDRHPGHPPHPQPSRLQCRACSGRLARRASRCRSAAWWHAGRGVAGPRDHVRAARCGRRARCAVTPAGDARALSVRGRCPMSRFRPPRSPRPRPRPG